MFGMDRLAAFNKLEGHPWLGKSFKKLTKEDVYFTRIWLAEAADLDRDTFNEKVVRRFLDDKYKPKAWKEIEELLIACNVQVG